MPQAHQDAQAQRLAVERRQLDGTATFHCLLSRLLMEGGHVSTIADARSQVFALRAAAEEQVSGRPPFTYSFIGGPPFTLIGLEGWVAEPGSSLESE